MDYVLAVSAPLVVWLLWRIDSHLVALRELAADGGDYRRRSARASAEASSSSVGSAAR